MTLRLAVVFILGLVIGQAVHPLSAQDRRLPGVNGVNHLAFVTPKYDEMMKFYTETLGFPEAFSNKNAEGQPTLTYLQASRNTFIELMPAGARRAASFTLRCARGGRPEHRRAIEGPRADRRHAAHYRQRFADRGDHRSGRKPAELSERRPGRRRARRWRLEVTSAFFTCR
jgi:catechol 2,3-dioxygenase-like lactoylglutathione lyase family enzyme